jgi:uncharacterized protein YjiS (DUF1127 family)
MASIDMSVAEPASRGVLSRIMARIASAATAYSVAQSRADQVQRLNEKTDAELARMGLRRENIAHYVFRDILYI